MKKSSIIVHILLFIVIIGNAGCGSMFKSIGRNVVAGANSNADTLTMKFISGLRTELENPKTQKVLQRLLDSIVINLSDVSRPRIKGIVNDVFNHKIILWSDSLVEALTGGHLNSNIANLQHSLIGKSKDDILSIQAATKDLLEEILSNETNKKLGNLRDQVLGPKTDTAISLIVEHASAKIANQIKATNNNVKEDISILGKWGAFLLLLLGIIAVIVITMIWWNKRRYKLMTTLLAKQIHNISNQGVYDNVTSKIKNEAITTGLEPHLRKILNANGLIGNPNWNK